MSNEFLTKGLQNYRYLKARQLAKQFEKEIEVELRTIGQKMIDENREWFGAGVEGSENSSRKSDTLPWARVDYPMARLQSRERTTTLKLNVHLYWVNPSDYNRTDVDGALRGLGYKIKNLAETDEQQVASESRDWPIQVAEDPFGGGKVYYRHVSSSDEIVETGEQLVEHFSAFSHKYGVPREDKSLED